MSTDVGLVVRFGCRLVLGEFDTEESVYLILGQRAVAGSRRHHEITHQLDLGLEVIVCEVVTSSLGCRHVPNLRASGPLAPSNADIRLPQASRRRPAVMREVTKGAAMLRRAGSASRHVAARSGLIWDPGLPRPDAGKL